MISIIFDISESELLLLLSFSVFYKFMIWYVQIPIILKRTLVHCVKTLAYVFLLPHKNREIVDIAFEGVVVSIVEVVDSIII